MRRGIAGKAAIAEHIAIPDSLRRGSRRDPTVHFPLRHLLARKPVLGEDFTPLKQRRRRTENEINVPFDVTILVILTKLAPLQPIARSAEKTAIHRLLRQRSGKERILMSDEITAPERGPVSIDVSGDGLTDLLARASRVHERNAFCDKIVRGNQNGI
ncbi:hypothetical protein D1872_277090 [compost metagenome]